MLVAWGLAPLAAQAQVDIKGLEGPLLENALVHLDLDEEPCEAPSWRITEQFENAGDEIRTALEAFGFYGAAISSTLEFDEACWRASFTVELGEPVRLRRADIELLGEASDDAAFGRLLERIDISVGEPLVHSRYEELKRGWLDLAQRRGYVEARFSSNRIDVYPDEGAADIALRFESGPRYAFGDIEIKQDVLDPQLLQRYYEFRPGDPYNRAQLTALYGVLVDSGYFSSVDVRPLAPDADTKLIPVAIELAAGTRRQLSYGVGFSTDTGPRLRLGRANRRLNERGAQFSIDGQLSPVISELGFNYRFPYGDPRSEWISLDAGIKHEDTDTAVSDSIKFGARRVIARRPNWQETQFLNLLVEDFEIAGQFSRSRLLVPGVSWYKVDATNTLRPERGHRLAFEITAAGDALGSDTSFLQIDVDGKWIRSFGSHSRILIRGKIGAMWEEDFNALPPSVRFFAGGDNSVRGYKFESLGPRDAGGDVIGGNRLAVASVEYERAVTERWSVATFVDSGNAFKDGDLELKSGAGVGFRWQSPLGPIRVDVAKPLNDADRDLRLHVSLGADL